MKFIDYEASHITPQMTLLQKQNEILKFLRELNPDNYSKLYSHRIRFGGEGFDANFVYTCSRKEPFTSLSEIWEYFGTKDSLFSCVMYDDLGEVIPSILSVAYTTGIGYTAEVSNENNQNSRVVSMGTDIVKEI